MRFCVHNLRSHASIATFDSVSRYLQKLHRRFRHAIHAETRVYTCRTGRVNDGMIAAYGLHWNQEELPGEELLGSFDWFVDEELVRRIEAEFASGKSVRLFVFDSDSDLSYEEVLEPVDG